jgi:hypothetical protein
MLFNQFLKGHKAFVEEQRKVQGITRRSSLTISAKPVGVGAGSQPLILAGKRSGLLTHIAATESLSPRERMKTSQPLSNLKELSANHRASQSKGHADCLEYLACL